MTDEELKALVARLATSHLRVEEQLAKTDAQLAKTDAQLAKTDGKLNRLAEMMGQFSNNQGDIAEEFYYRSLSRKPRLGHLEFEWVYRKTWARSRDLNEEFDLVLVNGDCVAVVAVKNKAHPNEVDKLVDTKIPHFKTLFPHFAGFKIYAALAIMASNLELEQRARERGIFFITQKGRHLVVVQEGVRPL